VVAALADAALLERLKAGGSEAVGSTPAEFERFMTSELAKWTGVVRKAGIKSN
jgi:tripartite-type tricarboxylate transporter receptor subunit TctC